MGGLSVCACCWVCAEVRCDSGENDRSEMWRWAPGRRGVEGFSGSGRLGWAERERLDLLAAEPGISGVECVVASGGGARRVDIEEY